MSVEPERAMAGRTESDGSAERRGGFLRRAAAAVGIGLLLYAAAFAYVERATARTAERNPFHKVTAGAARDGTLVVLGASRALPLEYQDMLEEVEEALGRPVTVLALPGGGVIPNALVMDHYLRRHGPDHVGAVLYVVDSFAFFDREWNEARLDDERLWQKAPFDPHLVAALARAVREYGVAPSVLFGYVSGFTKLNDPTTWFGEDRWEGERSFDRSYEPSERQDRERIDYLYPDQLAEATFRRYASIFAELVDRLNREGIEFIAVKPPLRASFLKRLPDEGSFDERMRTLVEEGGGRWHDLSDLGYGAELYYDPDHLNRDGVRRLLEDELVEIVAR